MGAASVLRFPVELVFNGLGLNVVSSSAMQDVRDKSSSEKPQERESHRKSRM